jgi:hypothetical protein
LKSPFGLLFGSKPILHYELKIFGEVGAVTTKDKFQSKLTNHGSPCTFVGYAENHSRDVYRMLNLDTNSIIESRDIIWLKKMHVDWFKNKSTTKLEEEDVLELSTCNESNKVKEEAAHVDVDKKKKTNEKILREMRKLESWFNPQATKIVDELDHGREIVLEQVNLALLTLLLLKNPLVLKKPSILKMKMIKRLGKKQSKRN